MKDANLMFILKRVPKKNSFYFKAKAIEFCVCDIDIENMNIADEIQVFSNKYNGEYLPIFPKIDLLQDEYVYPFNIDNFLQLFNYEQLELFIEDYNNGSLGNFIYHFIPKTGNIDIFYLEPGRKKACDLRFVDKIESNPRLERTKVRDRERNNNIMNIYEDVRKYIIGQDEAVKKVLSTIYTNQKLINSDLPDDKIRNLKQNVLITGSTGTGKTEMIKQIAKKLNVPFVIEDATKYTQAGYVGSNIEDMIKHLVTKCNGSIEQAQCGILVIDEIDKKAGSTEEKGVSSVAVQNSLLKLLEGEILHIDADRENGTSAFDFDTSKLTVIFSGAFSELNQTKKAPLGFTTAQIKEEKEKKLVPEDFIKYGMAPEFMGRISNIIITKNFDKEAYYKILLESEISPLNLKKELLKTQGINIKYNENFINKIIDDAVKINTGARGLKLAVDKDFDELEFELLKGNVESIELDDGKPKLIKHRVRK